MKYITLAALLTAFSDASAYTIKASTDRDVYDCSDKIELNVSFTGLESDSNSILVKWVTPAGRTQDSTFFSMPGSSGQAHGEAWLELHRATGAGIFSLINPSAGYSDFIGPWTAEIRLNGRTAGAASFVVEC